MENNETNKTWPSGLIMVKEFISPEEEEALMAVIDKQPWSGKGIGINPEMRRRTQHYGYEFSYSKRKVIRFIDDTPMPSQFSTILDRIVNDPRQLWQPECSHLEETCNSEHNRCRLFHTTGLPPDSVIVNEYEKGQGIMPHTDGPSAFGPVVASLSLLSDCLFTFDNPADPEYTLSIKLPRRSLVIMRGFTRYQLRHGIAKNLVEFHNGETIDRGRRVSLTIRRIGHYGYNITE
ncbi:hypothetical protein BDF19DRAFT_442134 [Syncephalis fuscata]|nr:hypothetical protein BDF19DRAFT_442134 [Syncephalis fuscata]